MLGSTVGSPIARGGGGMGPPILDFPSQPPVRQPVTPPVTRPVAPTIDYDKLAEAVVAKMKDDGGFKGDAGPEGPTGPQGEQGDPGTNGRDGRGVASVYIDSGHLIVEYDDGTSQDAGSVVIPEEGAEITHMVLVRDVNADYWSRMQGELEIARGHYSAIEEADPPPFSVPLPQLIAYQDGKAVFVAKGVRDVSQALSDITRDEFDLLLEEETL